MNRNSALFWLPNIEAAGLPTPKTIVAPYSHDECLTLFDGEECPEFGRLIDAVRDACQCIGYPVFLRTDLASAKHDGPASYRADSPATVPNCLARTIEDNEMKFWMEREGPKAILVRQFLELDAPFTAFRGLPVSREWRFFATPDRVLCAHPYWPEEAIESHLDSGDLIWRPLLAELHERPEDSTWLALCQMAHVAARSCQDVSEAWSVDLAQDKGGKWWLVDMAVAQDSYHWPGCEFKAKNRPVVSTEPRTPEPAHPNSDSGAGGM